jgi:hypothetical protein
VNRAAAFALLIALAGARVSYAQLPSIKGYYLNVPVWSDSTPFAIGGFGDINRLRFMTRPALGPLSLEVAYEHLVTYNQREAAARSGGALGVIVPGGGEWLDLQWTIKESDHVVWGHRFDRLNLEWAPVEPLDLALGRQTISWATTLILTPADPFIPFDPSDPFREFRAGVDALRVQAFPGPLSDLDFVVRPSKTPVGETLTLAGRGRTVWWNWEVSAWAGMLHDEPATAVGAAGSVGSLALRTEASLREEDDDLVFRGTVGLDRLFNAFDRDLFVVLEYQHDGFGASSAEDLSRVIGSDPFARGELQVLGRDEIAAQSSYQVHPLWSTGLLLLWNLNDGSALLAPSVSYSASNEVTLRGGLFLGLGDDTAGGQGELPSEYGIVPTFLYVSLTAFF